MHVRASACVCVCVSVKVLVTLCIHMQTYVFEGFATLLEARNEARALATICEHLEGESVRTVRFRSQRQLQIQE